jgi:serine/threonine protein kinase/tetratricopeptide (TPR) repeat protein
MSNKCPKCQTDNPSDSKYCKECATPLPLPGQAEATKTIETPKKELTTGSTFAGRYQIIEELGKGGMGKVYKVHDIKIKEKIALKLIKSEIAKDKKTIERFSNELRLARKIRHKNICQMFDLGEEKGTHFITMEFVPGQDLKGLIRQSGQLAVGTTINIAKQICDGLTEAHKSGVVHRDLKPSNIMIDKEGNVRIMDFGIARSLKAKGITGAGVMIGTPEYMSPEQVEGKEVDQRSDIYSLGIILYEMVTGRVPFEGDTPFTVGVKHKSEIPQNPKELNTQISDDLNNVILRCLEKDKENRFQKAGKVLSELLNIEEGIPTTEKVVPGKKPLTSKEITITFGLKKLLFPALIVVVLVLIGIIIWRPWSQKEAVPVLSDKPSLAVMYFENNTGEEGLEYLRSGLAEWFITDISQSRYINVLSGDRIFSILKKLNLLEAEKYSSEDLIKVANRGRVNHILKGSYIKVGNSFVITVMLQRPETGEAVSSRKVECKGEEEIPQGVDELTKMIKMDLNLSREQIAGDFDKQVGKITTSSPEAQKYYIEARKYHYLGQYSQSIPIYERALAVDPEFALAFGYMGTAYFWLGYQSKGTEYLQKALDLSDRVSDRERYYIQGIVYMGSEKTYGKSIEAYNKLLELYPDDNEGNNSLGIVYALIEEWDKAIEPYISCIQRKDEVIWPYLNLSFVYRAKGLYDKAKEVLEYYLNNISDNAEIHNQLALTYLCQEKYDLSLVEVDKALSMDPDNYFYFLTKGDIYHCKGDLIKAEKEYQKVLELGEKVAHLQGRQSLGALYLSQGRFEKSEEHLKQGIILAKELVEKRWESSLQLDYAYRHLKSGRFKEALKEFQNAQEAAIQGESLFLQIFSLYYKGIAYLEMKSMDEAQRAAAELKELIESGMNKKAIRYYHHLMGMIELKRKNFSKAVEFFKRGISLLHYQCYFVYHQWITPDSHALFVDPLALAYYKMGDLDKAQEKYEKITSLSRGRLFFGNIYAKSI